ncbi:MAG: hypothetical protein K9G26_04090 [Emcibacter sp.]|nr:hypothetical protein [Emcibacter sp.]
MNIQKKPEKESNLADLINRNDLQDIRDVALSNISEEIMQISDLVENSIVDLSDEFQALVKYSKQQVDDLTTACIFVQGELRDKDEATQDIINEMFMASAEISTCFHQNVNRMIYTMQFQDRARQLMLAISATLNILLTLSQKIERGCLSDSISDPVEISENNKNILRRIIQNGEHKELDQNYILKMFLGHDQHKGETENVDAKGSDDIEFF